VCADLVDRREVVEEAVARGPQVQPPDPHALGARDPRRLVEVGIEALGPVAQRLGVVGLEVLHVPRDESRALQREQHDGELQRLAVGEHVALGERARRLVGVAQAGDAVVEEDPPGPQEAGELGPVAVDLLRADVLDHADAGHLVELLARQVAVVEHADVDEVGDAGLRRPGARALGLRRGQRDPGDAGAVALGGVHREGAPAAAHVQQPVAGLEVQLAADQVPLGLLGLLQRARAAREDRAGVGHRRVEERREELVRDVVVVAHAALVAVLRVPAALGLQLGGRRRRRRQAGGAGGGQDEADAVGGRDRAGLPVVDQPMT
jgi:hypothetical protein